MTHLATILSCNLLALTASPAVEFDGEQYVASYFTDQPNLRLVEFVRANETVENWTKLFAIRNFPQKSDPREAVLRFQQVIKEHNPLAGVQVLVKEDGSEAMIDFLTWEKGAKTVELNIHRYLKKPGHPGLISYQFAYRFESTVETSAAEIRKLKDRWCELLRQIDPPIQFGK